MLKGKEAPVTSSSLPHYIEGETEARSDLGSQRPYWARPFHTL